MENSKRKKLVSLVVVSVLAMSGLAFAGSEITGVTIEDESVPYNDPGSRAVHIINGNGLNVNGPGTHDKDQSDWLNKHWLSGVAPSAAYVTFDLGGLYDLENVRIWNENENAVTGVKDMYIQVSADNVTYVDSGLGLVTISPAPQDDTYDFSETIALGGLSNVRYVKFDVETNYGYPGPAVGLSEVRFYREVSDAYAYSPQPGDEEPNVHPQDVTLSWLPSDFAADVNGHHVYFGTDEADVNNGTGGTDKGTASVTGPDGEGRFSYNAGLLEVLTTYYWRIDEINDPLSPDPCVGDVWEFTTRDYIHYAYSPQPEDLEDGISNAEDVNLSWLPGDFASDVNGHHVYFGSIESDVTNGTGGTDKGTGSVTGPDGDGRFSYNAGSLDVSTTYYWRIDEINDPLNPDPCTGDVWEFTTFSLGSGSEITGVTVIDEAIPYADPQTRAVHMISGEGLNPNGPGTHSTAWFPAATDHWLARPNSGSAADAFAKLDLGAEYDLGKVEIWNYNESPVAGVINLNILVSLDDINYTLAASVTLVGAPGNETTVYSETFSMGGATARYVLLDVISTINIAYAGLSEIRFYAMLPDAAYSPQPLYRELDVTPKHVTLSWLPGPFAAVVDGHHVYFGTNKSDVTNGAGGTDKGTGGVTGPDGEGRFSYNLASLLESETIYYWRIDEVNNPASPDPCTGEVWEFTTRDYIHYAYSPQPEDEQEDVPVADVNLSWLPGDYAADVDGHHVYFGTDEDNVNNGTGGTDKGTGSVTGPDADGRFSYNAGLLEFDTTYYWRIDEINNPSSPDPCTGDVWEFTTGFCLSVDDMESYFGDIDNGEPTAIRSHYRDGYTDSPESSGSNIYNVQTTEYLPWNVIAYQGSQMLIYAYNNTGSIVFTNMDANGVDYGTETYTAPYFSEIRVDTSGPNSLGFGGDWIVEGVKALVIHFYGDPDNSIESMYAVLESTDGNVALVKYEDYPTQSPNDLQEDWWHEWNIDLADFNAPDVVDLQNIRKFYIGFGDRYSPSQGGSGIMFFDNIKLCIPACWDIYGPQGDVTSDCSVDEDDLDLINRDWLDSDSNFVLLVPPEANLVAQYNFENNVTDSSANAYHGTITGSANYVAGQAGFGNAFSFNGSTYINLPVGTVSWADKEISITFWAKASPSPSDMWAAFFADDSGAGGDNMAVKFPWNDYLYWSAGGDLWQYGLTLYESAASEEVTSGGEWAHWAFTKNANDGFITMYKNGIEIRPSVTGKTAGMDGANIDVVQIGAYNGGNRYVGLMDDFRIYDGELTILEVQYVMSGPSDARYVPFASPKLDMHSDDRINFKDYAVLANDWLEEWLWPFDGWQSITPKVSEGYEWKDRRIIYNSDGGNYLIRCYPPASPDFIRRHVDEVLNTQVDTILICPNEGLRFIYPTQFGEMIGEGATPAQDAAINAMAYNTTSAWSLERGIVNLRLLVAAGYDPVTLMVNRAREKKLETFITYRMNDSHGLGNPEVYGLTFISDFWLDHPEWRTSATGPMNFAIPEVRERRLAQLTECCERFDIDGLELDFLRHPDFFPSGTQPDNRGVMTAFVRTVREMTESVGNKRGRSLLLTARVPDSLAGCTAIGLDPVTWAEQGLIDFLTPSQELFTQAASPIAEFKNVIQNIPIYGDIQLEWNIGGSVIPLTPADFNDVAQNHFQAGADGIMLFNFFACRQDDREPDWEVLNLISFPQP